MDKYGNSKKIDSRISSLIASELESPRAQAGETRIIFQRAFGAYLEDVDGNRYIDFSNGLGSVILGHNDPDVNRQLIKILEESKDVVVGPSQLHADAAECIVNDLDKKSMVAFFSSGTAAVKAAAALVLHHTSKPIILSAGYHGWDSFWLPGPDLLTPNPTGVIDFFFCLDYFTSLLDQHRGSIAGVVISPDYLFLDTPWYRQFFDTCRRENLLVVCDEVKQGYRYGPGSSLRTMGYTADLYVFGKCLANGQPIACLAGDREILRHAREMVNTGFHARLPFAACTATLQKMARLDVQQTIRRQGDKFLHQARTYIQKTRLPIEIVGNGHLFVFLIGDKQLEHTFYQQGLDNGLVFFAGDNQTPSFALTDQVISESLEKFTATMAELESQFAHLRDSAIPEQSKWETAYRTMEGFPFPLASGTERARFLRGRAF